MHCVPTRYIQYQILLLMNGLKLKFEGLLPEEDKKYVADEITICVDCASLETTILTFGTYCRKCRNFRYFKNRIHEEYHPTGTILDLD